MNSKIFNEELVAQRDRVHRLVNQADGREFFAFEQQEFDAITARPNGTFWQTVAKRDAALAQERKILEQSEIRRGRIMTQSISGNSPYSNQQLVLPVNGVLPENQERPRVAVRVGKLKAFRNEGDAFNAGMFLRAAVAQMYNRHDADAVAHCQRLGWQVTNAGIEGTGASGGYLVPAPIASALIDVRERVGVARRTMNIQPMTADTLSVNRRDGGLTVYYGSENPSSDMTASDKSWSQIELVAKKRYVVHQISQELVDDALISVVDDAVNEMGYALASKEDAEFINGDGTSSYGGIMGLKSSLGSAGVSTAATGHDTWGELDIADFTAAIGKLPDKYGRFETAWICSSAFYHTAMLKVLAQAGGNTIVSLQAGAGAAPTFLGAPVYFSEFMPTSTAVSTVCAFYGAFSQAAILGDRMGIRIGRSDEFAFLRDLVTLKATSRYDMNVHAGGDASNSGAYVGLSTAS